MTLELPDGTDVDTRSEHQAMAERGTILRVLVGSGVHGTAIDGQDDRDEMGICIEGPEYVIGLRRFEQYEWRTQPQGVRSGAGDLDLVVYSLRKWMRLALQGNPTVLLPLFVPDHHVFAITEPGRWLRAHPDLVYSRQAGLRFLGYLRAQRDRLEGTRGGRHTNRPELESIHGYDTKYAMHMCRLGLQGVEYLSTGRITLPVPEPGLSWLRQLRRGELAKDEALDVARMLESQLESLTTLATLPERPDYDAANAWLTSAYMEYWQWCEDCRPSGIDW